MIQELEEAKENLENAETCGQQAADAITAAHGDPLLIEEEIPAVNQKYAALLDQLKDKQAKLEQAMEQGTQIQENLDDTQAWAADSAQAVENWEPISTDPAAAKKQLEELEVCLF